MDCIPTGIALIRSTDAEKGQEIEKVQNCQQLRNDAFFP